MTIDIAQYITKTVVVTDLRARTKEEAVAELVDRIFKITPARCGSIDKAEAVRQIVERERLQSKGVERHVAFPHARIKGWGDFAIALGISRQGIDFSSVDKKPVYFICLMISSQEEPYIILQAMAAMARFMTVNKNAKAFFAGHSQEDIVKEFAAQSVEATRVILARDIMRPPKACAQLDSSVEDVARIMHLNHLDVLPVVDNENKFYGEVSCFHIFEYSIPDFFHQLNTVSFVRHFDPFEKYFKIKHSLAVKDILKSGSLPIPEDTTLVEIIFQLTVKNRPKLFVINGGHLIGEIDRFSIIDKILFF